MAAEWNNSRAESNRKFRMQGQKEMEAEEDKCDGQWSNYNQRQDEWRNNTSSRMRGHEPRMLSTIRSVSEEVEKEINSFVLDNGLNENKQLVNTKRNECLGEGHRIQKPISKPRKSLVQTHDLDITRFRNNEGGEPSEIAYFIGSTYRYSSPLSGNQILRGGDISTDTSDNTNINQKHATHFIGSTSRRLVALSSVNSILNNYDLIRGGAKKYRH